MTERELIVNEYRDLSIDELLNALLHGSCIKSPAEQVLKEKISELNAKTFLSDEIIKELVEGIFTDGSGRKANRLVMEFDTKFNETGWCRNAIEGIIKKHFAGLCVETKIIEAFLREFEYETIKESGETISNSQMAKYYLQLKTYLGVKPRLQVVSN